jgi:uncharacterized protein (DUF1697 family)
VARHVVLLRGINLGSRNRIAMPALRAALEKAGFDDVQTYVQSGNVVLASKVSAKEVGRAVERLIADEFGLLDVAALVRTRSALARVVERNPLADVAGDPKRYQVSFLDGKPTAAVLRKLEEAAAPEERFVHAGSEIYAWHPDGMARSKLWTLLAGSSLGVTSTARNWTTVTKLLELATRT